MIYTGGCHCWNIAFEVTGELTQVMQCNCSLCSKRGALMWFVPAANFRLLTPIKNYATYTFHTHKIKHRICPACGCAPFEESVDAETGDKMVAINTRCLNDVDLSALAVVEFDGRKL
jgi:hypothetical protein